MPHYYLIIRPHTKELVELQKEVKYPTSTKADTQKTHSGSDTIQPKTQPFFQMLKMHWLCLEHKELCKDWENCQRKREIPKHRTRVEDPWYEQHKWKTTSSAKHECSVCQRWEAPLTTEAPFTAASNAYIVKVGGQSSILSPGSNVHLFSEKPTTTTTIKSVRNWEKPLVKFNEWQLFIVLTNFLHEPLM